MHVLQRRHISQLQRQQHPQQWQLCMSTTQVGRPQATANVLFTRGSLRPTA